MKVYNIPEIKEDELLYSYIYRFMVSNSLTMSMFKEYISHDDGSYLFDLRMYINDFAKIINKDPYELFLKTTLYQAIGPLLRKEKQIQVINYCFRKRNNFPSLINEHFRLLGHLCYCPECVKEDKNNYGFAYIHRKHNIPGVKVCYKHNIPLIEINKKGKNPHEITKRYSVDEDDYKFAVFASEFMDAKIDSDQTTIINKLFNDGCNYKELINKNRNNNVISPDKLLKLLYKFYKKVPNFNKKEEKFSHDGYELLSEYNSMIIKMRKQNNTEEFITTHFGFDIGWRDETLDNDKTEEEKYKEILEKQFNREFVLDDKFENISKPIKHIHLKCGRIIYKEPIEFLNKSVRCICSSTIDDVMENIKSEYFETKYLLNGMVYVRCKKCGTEKTIQYDSWVERKICLECERRNKLNKNKQIFNDQLKQIYKGEYKLIGEYKGSKIKTSFKHMECGCVFDCLPYDLLRGRRCSCKRYDKNDFIKECNKAFKGRYVVSHNAKLQKFLVKDIKEDKSKLFERLELSKLLKDYVLSNGNIDIFNHTKKSNAMIVHEIIKNNFKAGDVFTDKELSELINDDLKVDVNIMMYYLKRNKSCIEILKNRKYKYLGENNE